MKSIRTRSLITPFGLLASAGRISPILTAASAAALLAGIARAQTPQGGQVVNGQATITHNGNFTGITAGNGAIINWQSFNIGQGQTVQFFQPGASSRVLNRVTGPDPSQIAGSLIANGNVYIVNPAGIYFAHGSLVNVGGIYAAAGNITNADFLNNVNHFTGAGTVENRGTINSPSAHLIGQRVANYGTINAPNGMVTMTAGSDVYVGEQNGQIFARVSGGPAGGTGVTQAGQINAAGGRVALGAGDMYAMAIDHPGSTKAKEIRLEGGATGVVSVSGTLDASDRSAGGVGGRVEVLGDKVGIFGGRIDASGDSGGGTVLVGGDRQGQGNTRRADATYVSQDATLRADAERTGDGGKVVVWSDRFTNFQGRASAKGGAQGGDGGFIETSGKKDLYMSGSADASSPHGRAGSWLLDPTDVTLSNAVTSGGTLSGGGVFTPGNNATANVNLTEITSALAGGTSVTINTTSAGTGNGDITLVDPLSVTLTGGNATLTLNAVRDIHIDNTLTGTGAAGNALGLALNAGRDCLIGSAISLNGGALAINATGTVGLTAGITTSGGAVSVTNSGITRLGASIDAGSGDILLDTPMLLTANVTLSGHNLTFNGTVDSDSLATPRDLILNTSGGGVTRFNADAGATADLGTVTTNADGTTVLNSQFFKGMTVTFGDAVRVDVDAVVRGLTSVTFNSTIDSQATEGNDLQVNSPLTRFNGNVGNAAPDTALGLFQTNQPGTTTINTPIVKADRVNFRDAIVLGVITSVTGSTSVSFGGTINAETGEGNGLFVNSPSVFFGGDIGQGPSGLLGFLHVTQPGTTTVASTTISSVTLDFQSNVVLNSSAAMNGSVVTFGGTLDSAAGAGNSLVISSPLTTFNGNVGQAAGGQLGSLITDSTGTTVLNASQILASVVVFNDPVTIKTDTTVTGLLSVIFGSTIDSEVGFGHSLAVGGPSIGFNGSIGQTGLLSRLATTGSHSIATINSGVISSVISDFGGSVTLGSGLVVNGSSVAFRGPVNSELGEANNLTINSPQTTITGPIGNQLRGELGTLTTDPTGTTTIGAFQIIAGVIDFFDAVLINANTSITGSTRVTFHGTVDSTGGANDLTLTTPSLTFLGDIGAGSGGALGQLFIGPASNVNLQSANVLADIVDIRGAVLLGTDTTITGTTSVSFSNRIDSEAGETNDLTINSPLTTLAGRIGELSATSGLGRLSTNITGTTTISATSITADSMNFADAVVIAADTTLRGATSVTFGGTVDSSAGGAHELTINSALTTFSGRVGAAASDTALGKLVTDSAGSTVVNTDVLKAATVEFDDAVVIGVSTAITGTSGVEFQGSINSEASEGNGLTVNSPRTLFDGTVGAGTNGALGAIVTDDAGTTTFGATVQAASLTSGDTVNINGGSVTTTGDQTFNGSVFLGTDTTLSGHNVAFNLALNSGLTDRALTINSSGGGITTLAGPVGAINPLKSLVTNADGQTVLSGGQIITGGDQTYNDRVVLGLTTNISATNISFAQSINSDTTARTLNINSTNNGTTLFAGAIGDINPLLRLTTNSDGVTKVNGGAVTTTSTQAFNDSVILGAATTLSGGSVAFGSTLNSDSTARALTINTSNSGQTTFNAAVGGSAPLASITTGTDGTTRLFGGTLRTTGDQTFNNAVLLGANATLTGNDITFTSTIDSTSLLAAASLTVNSSTSGTTTFGGTVGGTNPLKALTTNADGKTRIGANITTTDGSINLGDAVLIFRDATLRDNGATGISFGGTIDSEGAAHALSILVNTSSNATAAAPGIARISFGGDVGATLALSQLRIGGNRTTVPTAATIVAGLNSTGTPIANFSISFNTTGAFTMGAFQKMSIVGNVAITCGGVAAIADIAALGSISVNAPSITIRTRPGAPLLVNQAGSFGVASDSGTDFVAGGTINFSVTPTLIGGFGTASFATPDSTGISPTLLGYAQRSFGKPVTQDLMHSGSNYLDLAANGPSNTNVAVAIAGAAPSESQSGVVQQDTAAGRTEQEELNKLGIVTRTPDEKEFLQLLLGKTMVSDVTERADPTATDHSISINRLPAVVVDRVLETYRSVFWQETYDDAGNVTRTPQPERVSQALTAAWKEYSTEAGAKADPAGFRAYLEAVPSRAEALNYLNGLRELFSELGYLGLSPVENRIAKNTILRSVPVQGLTPAQLEAAITSRQMGGS